MFGTYARNVIAGQGRYPKSSDGCCHKTVTTRCPDCSYKDPGESEATLPLDHAEKRLERLERALLRLCDGADKRLRIGEPTGWWSTEIRKILAENS